MKKTKVKTPVVSLGMSLGTFVKDQLLTPDEWAHVIEARRLQIAEFLDRLTLPTIGDLLLEGRGLGFGDSHRLEEDAPAFDPGEGFYDEMYKTQIFEIARNDFRLDDWPDFEAQVDIIGLNRQGGEWAVIGVRYKQEVGGRKKALTVIARSSSTETVIRECPPRRSPSAIWHGLRNTFANYCVRKRAQLREFEQVEDWFTTEFKVFCAHAVKTNSVSD